MHKRLNVPHLSANRSQYLTSHAPKLSLNFSFGDLNIGECSRKFWNVLSCSIECFKMFQNKNGFCDHEVGCGRGGWDPSGNCDHGGWCSNHQCHSSYHQLLLPDFWKECWIVTLGRGCCFVTFAWSVELWSLEGVLSCDLCFRWTIANYISRSKVGLLKTYFVQAVLSIWKVSVLIINTVISGLSKPFF